MPWALLGSEYAAHLVAQLVDGEGFADHRHAGRHVQAFGIATGEQDRQLRPGFAGQQGQRLAVHAGQAHVGHHQVDAGGRVADQRQCGVCVAGLEHRELQLFEHIDDQHAHDSVVFHDENAAGFL